LFLNEIKEINIVDELTIKKLNRQNLDEFNIGIREKLLNVIVDIYSSM
jgi:hypothetical protein